MVQLLWLSFVLVSVCQAGCHVIYPFDVSPTDGGRDAAVDREREAPGLPPDDSALDAPGILDTGAKHGWWHPGWLHRKKITVDANAVQKDLSNFVVMVDLSPATDLLARVQPKGQDLKFTLPNQVNALAHELEDPDVAAAKLVAWVQLPKLSAGQPTVFYVYYDNPKYTPSSSAASPWDASFVGVWHLSAAPAPTTLALDATAHHNDLSYYGAMDAKARVPGMIAGCLSFDGVDDRLTTPSSAALEVKTSLSISAWVNAFSFQPNSGTIVSKAPNYGSANTDYLLRAGPTNLTFWAHDGAALTNVGWGGWSKTHEWHHVAGSYDGATLRLYFDGAEVASKPRSGPIRSSSRQFNIGSFGKADTTRTWLGLIDEVRISNVARSAAWIAAEVKNQQTPTVFYSVGPEEAKPAP